MLTKEDFIQQYFGLNDEDLYQMFLQKEQYSEEGQRALIEVITTKGGLSRLELAIEEKRVLYRETRRIETEVRTLAVPGVNDDFILKMITSDVLPKNHLDQIVRSQLLEVKLDQKDKTVTPRTIWGSIAGGSIAAVVGGILC